MKVNQSELFHPKYRPDVDGLRAVAVLAVVIFHAFPNLVKGGFIGVDVFFVISGYLISTIIFENLDRGTFSFSEFYVRRIKRLFPALALVLFTCFVFGWFALLADELKQLVKHIAAGVGFVSNFVFWSEAGYFDTSAETKPLLHLWSLGIEEQFYIFWPLLLWFAWKYKFNFLKITLFVTAISFFLNIQGVKQDAIATFYSPQTRFWELLSGSFLAYFVLYKKPVYADTSKKLNSKITINVISFIGLLLLTYGFFRVNKDLSFPGIWALIPVLGSICLIFAGPNAWINQKILSNRVLVWFGLISFPLYLWHWPILSFGRIINDQETHRNFRVFAILLSIFLSWLTVKFIEKPFRFSSSQSSLKVVGLCCSVLIIGAFSFSLYKFNLLSVFKSNEYKDLVVKRLGFEHRIGSSIAWYRGKNDWLFLGNSYDNTVAKLKLATTPSKNEVNRVLETFSNIAKTGAQHNTEIVLIIGPNKSSIYPEYLPDELIPSDSKYINFFLDGLKKIPNLSVSNSTDELLHLKKSEGILYFKTDTHWNSKGAFLAYRDFSKRLGLPVPRVEFESGSVVSGDLISISKLKDFPLHAEDNWNVIWKEKPFWTETEILEEQKTAFGAATVVNNQNPLSSKYIWVVGDSFTSQLKQYFNATFKEVRYVGHWSQKLKSLPLDLAKADRKPDMIIIVRVERSF